MVDGYVHYASASVADNHMHVQVWPALDGLEESWRIAQRFVYSDALVGGACVCHMNPC